MNDAHDEYMPFSERRQRRVIELGEDIVREMETMSLVNPHVHRLYHALINYPEGSAIKALWGFFKIMANTTEIMQKQLLDKFQREPGRPIVCLCSECGKTVTLNPKEVPQ